MLLLLLAALGAALLSAALTPAARQLAQRANAVDAPGGRRRHAGPIPRGGGLALAVAAVAVMSAALYLPEGPSALRADNPDGPMLLLGLIVAGSLAAALGWLDDVRDLSPLAQMLSQLVVGLVAIRFGLWLEIFGNPLSGGVVDLKNALGLGGVVLVTLAWYLGFINTVNWLDGIDGLAASVAAVAATLFAIHMITAFDQMVLAILPAAVAGACLGFLPWNLAPARVFMGSAGTMFLGFAIAALALIAPAKLATALLVMAIPIVDVAWQILYRLRSGRAPWRGDRGHLHHRLFDRGWSPKQVVVTYVLFSALLGTIAVLVPEAMAGRGLVKLAALALTGGVTFLMLWHLARSESPPDQQTFAR